MAAERPWWTRKPSRWASQVEEALASDSDTAIGLAWAIILMTGGREEEASLARFSERTGMPRSAVTMGLQGKSFGSKQQKRVRKADPRIPANLFKGGRHPFAIRLDYLGIAIEPGHPHWASLWDISASEPGHRKSYELREEHPEVFPDYVPPEADSDVT